MQAVEVERAAADDAAFMLKDDKVADIFADLGQRARQQSAVAGVGRDQSMELFGIGKNRITGAHGTPWTAAGERTCFPFPCFCFCLCFCPWVGSATGTVDWSATPGSEPRSEPSSELGPVDPRAFSE